MRSLLTEGTPGPNIWVALTWAAGILVVSYTLAVAIYHRRAPVQGSTLGPGRSIDGVFEVFAMSR